MAKPSIHQAFDRVFLGFRGKTLDEHGVCMEYTDPMKTREGALAYLRTHLTFRSKGFDKMVVVKVFSRVPRQLSYKRALEDILGDFKRWEELRFEIGLPPERCKEIWALVRG